MAFDSKAEAVGASEGSGIASRSMRDPAVETGPYDQDIEKNGSQGRKMSRIGAPLPGILGDSDSDSTISVGKQLELESNNSIKYRTCSWPKVKELSSLPRSILFASTSGTSPYFWYSCQVLRSFLYIHLPFQSRIPELEHALTPVKYLDCRPALLRVYILGYHVVPLLLLSVRSGPWPDPDDRCCSGRTVHVSRFVVSPDLASERLLDSSLP